MNVGEVNKGAIMLILVMLLGAGGYLWYSQMYKPAVLERDAAAQGVSAAQSGLDAAKAELAAAQQRIDAAKSESSKVDDSVARMSKARTAVPDRSLIDDAAIILMDVAARAGVDTDFEAGGDGNEADTAISTLQGAKPIDIEFEAVGSYAEMMQFMSLVEDTVDERDGKLYTHGRLFNVVKLQIGTAKDDNASSAGGAFMSGSAANDDALVMKKGDIKFTVTVRMYTSSTDNAQQLGEVTPDPAASATTGAAGGASSATGTAATGGATSSTGAAPVMGGVPTAVGGDPSAAGAAGTPGAAGSTAPAGAAAGGTPAATNAGGF